MLIHFAFGQLGKQGNTAEQTRLVIENILAERRLLVSQCREFIPVLPVPGAKKIPPEMFEVDKDEDGAASAKIDLRKFHELPDATDITYLPIAVSMICFIQIAFNQLKSTPHSKEYGKFGLVFENKFLHSQGAKPVGYYTENSLWNDPLIIEWSNTRNSKDSSKRLQLQTAITLYRKPATYFPAFAEQTMMKVTRTAKGTILEHYYKYDRYEIGYDFRNEQEYRIAFQDGQEYMYFTEKDLYMIVAPNSISKSQMESYLSREWQSIPQVKIFPG
jgi:hypothetical protein